MGGHAFQAQKGGGGDSCGEPDRVLGGAAYPPHAGVDFQMQQGGPAQFFRRPFEGFDPRIIHRHGGYVMLHQKLVFFREAEPVEQNRHDDARPPKFHAFLGGGDSQKVGPAPLRRAGDVQGPMPIRVGLHGNGYLHPGTHQFPDDSQVVSEIVQMDEQNAMSHAPYYTMREPGNKHEKEIYYNGMRSFAAASLVVVVLAFGCSGDPLFEGEDPGTPGQSEISIQTISDGALVSPEGAIPVELVMAGGSGKKTRDAWTLDVRFESPPGTPRETLRFGPGELAGPGSLRPIPPPAMEPGLCAVVVTLREGEGIIAQKKAVFFYDAGDYEITKIAAYPPSFLPGSTGIFRAFFSRPEGSDPFIRWVVDGRTVQERELSRGGDRFLWNAPPIEGVYPVRVDLFPFPPSPGSRHSFPAPLRLSGQVYVDKTRRLSDTDFAPEEEYHSLFHFLGNLEDHGTRSDKTERRWGHLEAIGEPDMDYLSDVFGYRLDGSSGFRTGEFLLPLTPEGELAPFTLRARIFPVGAPGEGVLFRALSDDGGFAFSVFTDREGVPAFRFARGDAELVKKSGVVLPSEKTVLLELSIESGGGILTSQWKIDQRVVASSADAFAAVPRGLRGYSFIGGAGGFVGLIDEFGIRSGTGPSRAGRDPEKAPPEGGTADRPGVAPESRPPERMERKESS